MSDHRASPDGSKNSWLRYGTRRRLTQLALLFVGFYIVSSFFFPSFTVSPSLSLRRASWPVTIREAGQEFIEIGPLELPKRVSVTDAQKPEIRVAILEHGGFHDEVIGALIKTMEDIGLNYTVYRDDWRWHYEAILKPFAHSLDRLRYRGEFSKDAAAGLWDVVIHTSCDYKWRDRLPGWIADSFVKERRMQVLCIQHELELLAQRERDVWQSAVDENRLTMMTLSPHTSKELQRTVMKWEYETMDPGWKNVTVDTFLALFPVDPETIPIREDSAVKDVARAEAGTIPSRLAILGGIEPFRRNFQRVINHLYEAIKADPASWGYRLDDGLFVSLDDPSVPPVTLHLVGYKPGNVEVKIAPEMRDVVAIHSGLEYDDFYRLIATMDLIIPAFNSFVYVDHKLSAAIPAAIISRVPILADPLVLEAYSFLRPPAVVLQPSSMYEIEAVHLLRQGLDPMEGERVVLPGYKPHRGVAPRREWDAYHERLYEFNRKVMRRLLGEIAERVRDPVPLLELEK